MTPSGNGRPFVRCLLFRLLPCPLPLLKNSVFSPPTMSSYATLIDQNILYLPTFTLESGVVLRNVPVAYKTWGKLNATRDNVMLICHAFTGSSAVEDWCEPFPPFCVDIARHLFTLGGAPSWVHAERSTLAVSSSSASTSLAHHMGPLLPFALIHIQASCTARNSPQPQYVTMSGNLPPCSVQSRTQAVHQDFTSMFWISLG